MIQLSKEQQRIASIPTEILKYYLMAAFKTETGGRLNKKDGLTRYGDSHVKDKTS